MSVNYYSIKEPFIDEIEIKKSRFITYLYPIFTQEEFDEHLAQIRKEHYRATHHCQAYILGEKMEVQRANDDGEPSGTAGVPMLEILKQHELTNIMAVTVRYFGGVKLGAGGLIRAYGGAVNEAVQKAPQIQNVTQEMIDLVIEYHQNDLFNYQLQQGNLAVSVIDTIYTDKVTYQLAINETDVDSVYDALMNLFSGSFSWTPIGQQTIDLPREK